MAQHRTDEHRPMQYQVRFTPEFLEACRAYMWVRRLSLRTEESYLKYIRCYIQFHGRKPEDLFAHYEPPGFSMCSRLDN